MGFPTPINIDELEAQLAIAEKTKQCFDAECGDNSGYAGYREVVEYITYLESLKAQMQSVEA
jgi:hypothetical protein